MRQSQLFNKTLKKAPKETQATSHQLLTRADFIEQTISGVYRFLPLGLKALEKIENIINSEMLNLGAQKLYLPALQNKKLWMETGRWQTIDPPLFKLKDRHQKETALGSTHEEEITDVVRFRIKSYRDLPFYLYQIQDKFRNEMRPSGGLLRTREFLMKDLYSFHSDEKDARSYYEKVRKAYFKIFQKCGLKALCVEADPGTIGGELSHEFMVLSEAGEDRIVVCKKGDFAANIEKVGDIKKCPKCKGILEKKNCIECGHTFYLGTKYTKAMGVNFVGRDGKQHLTVMGCYGIGLPRLMAAVVEINHDEKGIIWPKTVAPFNVHLIQIENNRKVKKASVKIYQDLQKQGIEVLYDDREDKSVGEKFAEADLIGVPLRLVISERTLSKHCLEIKQRRERTGKLVKITQVKKYVK